MVSYFVVLAPENSKTLGLSLDIFKQVSISKSNHGLADTRAIKRATRLITMRSQPNCLEVVVVVVAVVFVVVVVVHNVYVVV